MEQNDHYLDKIESILHTYKDFNIQDALKKIFDDKICKELSFYKHNKKTESIYHAKYRIFFKTLQGNLEKTILNIYVLDF